MIKIGIAGDFRRNKRKQITKRLQIVAVVDNPFFKLDSVNQIFRHKCAPIRKMP